MDRLKAGWKGKERNEWREDGERGENSGTTQQRWVGVGAQHLLGYKYAVVALVQRSSGKLLA